MKTGVRIRDDYDKKIVQSFCDGNDLTGISLDVNMSKDFVFRRIKALREYYGVTFNQLRAVLINLKKNT